MRGVRAAGRVRPWLAAALVLGAWGCEAGAGPELAEPPHRAGDALLTDATLQSVAEAQVRRDAQALVEFLGHARADVRARAAFALASVPSVQAVPGLVALLEDADAGVRRDAAFALGQAAQREGFQPLRAALERETDASVRHRILEALGKLGFPEVLTALVEMEREGAEEADRLLAIARQGAIHGQVTEASQNALMARLDHVDARVRMAAAYFFGRTQQPGTWSPRASRIRQALDGYADGDGAAIHLVKALGKLGEAADTERLAALATGSSDWRVRAEAMAALSGRPVDDVVEPVLFRGLDDVSLHVAVNAAGALGAADHLPTRLGRIAGWIQANPERWQVASPLLESLARHDHHESVLAWFDAVPAGDEDRLVTGIQALGELRGEEALTRLDAVLQDGAGRVGRAAVMAVRRRWSSERGDPRAFDRFYGLFVQGVRGGAAEVVPVAAAALTDPVFVARGSIRILLDAMAAAALPEDLPVVESLVQTLGQTGEPEVAGLLNDALNHPYQGVREVAARALGQHFGQEVEAPGGGETVQPSWVEAGEPDPSILDWEYLNGLGHGPRLVFETNKGRLALRMSSLEAPHTAQTLTRLAAAGRFDGVPFHRVVPNFVAQGGDVSLQDGRGGAGFAITTEITQIPYERGVAGMASAGRDTESSQFFLVHSEQPHLDGGYTSFGWLVEGGDVLDALARGDVILSAHVEPGA